MTACQFPHQTGTKTLIQSRNLKSVTSAQTVVIVHSKSSIDEKILLFQLVLLAKHNTQTKRAKTIWKHKLPLRANDAPSDFSEQKVTAESCRAKKQNKQKKKGYSRLFQYSTADWIGPTWNQLGSAGSITVHLRSSESALWGWGCSAAALEATWRSALGSAAGPAWWEQPRGQTQKKQGMNITLHTPTHTHRRIKYLKLKPKVCFSGCHVSPVFSLLHNKGNKRLLQKTSVTIGYCFFTRPFLWPPHRWPEMLRRMTCSMTFCCVEEARTFSWSCDETWLWPGLKPPPDGGTEGIPGPWKAKKKNKQSSFSSQTTKSDTSNRMVFVYCLWLWADFYKNLFYVLFTN